MLPLRNVAHQADRNDARSLIGTVLRAETGGCIEEALVTEVKIHLERRQSVYMDSSTHDPHPPPFQRPWHAPNCAWEVCTVTTMLSSRARGTHKRSHVVSGDVHLIC